MAKTKRTRSVATCLLVETNAVWLQAQNCNSLLVHLRQTDINSRQFKWQLSTFSFGSCDGGTL